MQGGRLRIGCNVKPMSTYQAVRASVRITYASLLFHSYLLPFSQWCEQVTCIAGCWVRLSTHQSGCRKSDVSLSLTHFISSSFQWRQMRMTCIFEYLYDIQTANQQPSVTIRSLARIFPLASILVLAIALPSRSRILEFLGLSTRLNVHFSMPFHFIRFIYFFALLSWDMINSHLGYN